MKEKKHWILAFLHSPGVSGNLNEPIDASLRLMKNLFLLWQWNLQRQLDNLYVDFKPYNFGPCDFSVYDGINKLKEEGLIEETMVTKSFSSFTLTPKGMKISEEVYNPLDDHIKGHLHQIKKETSSRKKLIELLGWIYNDYPKWAENSLIKV